MLAYMFLQTAVRPVVLGVHAYPRTPVCGAMRISERKGEDRDSKPNLINLDYCITDNLLFIMKEFVTKVNQHMNFQQDKRKQ